MLRPVPSSLLLLLAGCAPGGDYALTLRPVLAEGQQAPSGDLTLVLDGPDGRALRPAGPVGTDRWSLVDVGALEATSVGLLFTDPGAPIAPLDPSTARAWGRSRPISVDQGDEVVVVPVAAWGRVGTFGRLDLHGAARLPAVATLPDGRTFVFGGDAIDPDLAVGATEVATQVLRLASDLAEPAFRRVADLPVVLSEHASRVGATATPVAGDDGWRILVVGGRARAEVGTGGKATTLLFDPDTSTFTPGDPMFHGRSQHEAFARPDGTVLVLGGWRQDGVGLLDVEVYDPVTDAWAEGPSLTEVGGFGFAAAALPSGDVVACGGGVDDGGLLGATEGCRLIPGDGTAPIALPGMPPVPGQGTRRQLHAAAALADGRVLVAGGVAGPVGSSVADATTDAFVLDVDAALAGDPGAWTTVGPLGVPRALHRIVALPDGYALVLGGAPAVQGLPPAPVGTPHTCAERYDPATATFAPVAPCEAAGGGASVVAVPAPGVGAFVLAGEGGTEGGRAFGLIPSGPAPTP